MANLTTLANVKDWLATGTGAFPPTDDRLLSRLIASASVFLESWASQSFSIGNWQEIRHGLGGDSMVLQVTPIVAIIGLSVDGISVPAAPPMSQQGWSSGYAFSPTTISLRGYRFTRGTQNVIVQYRAGYAKPPPDIEQACIELVVRKYRERTRIGEISRSIGGAETVTYSPVAFRSMDMATDIQVLMQQYRRYTSMGTATPMPQDLTDLSTETQLDIIIEGEETPVTVEGPG